MRNPVRLAITLPDGDLERLAREMRVPKEFIDIARVQLMWGYRDPNEPLGGRIVNFGFSTFVEAGVGLTVLPPGLAGEIASEILANDLAGIIADQTAAALFRLRAYEPKPKSVGGTP